MVDRARTGPIRIGVLTYISRTASRQCNVFFRYTQSQGIPASDVHVVAGLPVPNATRRCYSGLVPKRNVREVNAPIHKEALKLQVIMKWQRKLLLSGFSHTLVLDPDEVVLVSSKYNYSLYTYVARNPLRGIIAPIGYEVQEIFSKDAPLDWERLPLLKQRTIMVQLCAYSKPIFAQVLTNFNWGTHHIAQPPYKGCWGKKYHFDCQDNDLFLVHLKCLDMASTLLHASELDDKLRGGGAGVAAVRAYAHARCGDAQRWYQSGCRPGSVPTLPESRRRCDSVNMRHASVVRRGPSPAMRIPEWLQNAL